MLRLLQRQVILLLGSIDFFAWKSDEFAGALTTPWFLLQVFADFASHFGISRCWMWDVFQFIESCDSVTNCGDRDP